MKVIAPHSSPVGPRMRRRAHWAMAAATTESSSTWVSWVSPGVGEEACTPPAAASIGNGDRSGGRLMGPAIRSMVPPPVAMMPYCATAIPPMRLRLPAIVDKLEDAIRTYVLEEFEICDGKLSSRGMRAVNDGYRVAGNVGSERARGALVVACDVDRRPREVRGTGVKRHVHMIDVVVRDRDVACRRDAGIEPSDSTSIPTSSGAWRMVLLLITAVASVRPWTINRMPLPVEDPEPAVA